jgi:hypothetical protein
MNPKQSFINKLLTGNRTQALSRPAIYSANNAPANIRPYNARGFGVTDLDLDELRKVGFGEINNVPKVSVAEQEYEMRTLANTAINRMPQHAAHGTPMSLTDTMRKIERNGLPSYQAYGDKQYMRLQNNKTVPTDAQKLASIDKIIAEIKGGNFKDNTGNRVFYTHDTATGKLNTYPGPLY